MNTIIEIQIIVYCVKCILHYLVPLLYTNYNLDISNKSPYLIFHSIGSISTNPL